MSDNPDSEKPDLSSSAEGIVSSPITAVARGLLGDTTERPPEMLVPRATVPEELADIVSTARENILKAFAGAPSADRLQDVLKRLIARGSDAEELIDLLSVHRFRVDGDDMSLFNDLTLRSLPPKDQLLLRVALLEVHRLRGEYSIALEHADAAVDLSRSERPPTGVVQAMIARGMCLAQLSHPDADDYHREIIAFAFANAAEDHLAWAYHNWATHLWQRGRHAESLLASEREALLRRREGIDSYFSFLFPLIRRLELVDRSRAVARCREAIEILADPDQQIFPAIRADAHYEIASTYFRCTNESDVVREHATRSCQLYDTWLGYESRAAWCCGLVAAAYDELGDAAKAALFRDERDARIRGIAKPRDLLANLARAVLAGTADDAELGKFEALLVSAGDPKLELGYYSLIALQYIDAEQPEKALSASTYSLARVDDRTMRTRGLEADVAIVLHARAEAHLQMKNSGAYLADMQGAVALEPSNSARRWLLCENAFRLGQLDIALREAAVLQSRNFGVGTYRLAARCQVALGELGQAEQTLAAALSRYPTHPELGKEQAELASIRLGILEPSASRYFRRVAASPSGERERDVAREYEGLPEYGLQPRFVREVLDLLIRHIHSLQKAPPRFVSDYKTREGTLDEADFRDECERLWSLHWRDVGAEVRQGSGRTDLLVRSPAPGTEAVVAEFKVWSRNDYKDIVQQLLGYVTDFDSVGIAFMVNPNKSEIARKYRDVAILGQLSYVVGSFRHSPMTNGRLDHYYSRHRSRMGKEIEVFHFIFNIWGGVE